MNEQLINEQYQYILRLIGQKRLNWNHSSGSVRNGRSVPAWSRYRLRTTICCNTCARG